MTAFEILTVVIACIAILISIYTLAEQKKLQKESNELQKATSALAKKQLEIIVREDEEKSSARLTLDLSKDGNGYKFYITNISSVDASNVQLDLLLDKPEQSPLIKSDYDSKFPAPKISPGSTISLIAELNIGRQTAFNAKLKWTNPDGKAVEDETFVSLL